jgi:Rieske Fe-S protein
MFLILGVRRRGWSWLSEPVEYWPLTRPVRIPLEQVGEPMRPVSFTAESMMPGVGAGARRVLLKGILYRHAEGPPGSALTAVCVTCPHEQCAVQMVSEPSRLARRTERPGPGPILECPCHGSLFDPIRHGAWVAGIAPRGLFRFRLGASENGYAEIVEIEQEALEIV